MDTLLEQVSGLIGRQMREWAEVRERYDALGEASMRVESVGAGMVVLQYNAARCASASARLDAASLAARPCFLCREHQPAEQEAVRWGDYKVQVNPYPITPLHLTVSDVSHTPQSLANPLRVGHMLELARELPETVVFYNGPQSGASAPQHFHFQAVSADLLPLCVDVTRPDAWPDDNIIEGNIDGCIAFSQQWGRFVFMIKTREPVQAQLYFARLQVAMMMAGGAQGEPMQNVLCRADDEAFYLVVVPRRKHRPDCYGDADDQLLVSPASTEMAGMWALARKQDYDRLDVERLKALYDEVCIDTATAVRIIECYYKTLNNDNE